MEHVSSIAPSEKVIGALSSSSWKAQMVSLEKEMDGMQTSIV